MLAELGKRKEGSWFKYQRFSLVSRDVSRFPLMKILPWLVPLGPFPETVFS